MPITNEQYEERYTKATPAQKYLCSSPKSGAILMSLAEKYDVKDNESYKRFAIVVGDIVLGFYKPEDIAKLMQQELSLSPQISTALASDVKLFLKPLSDPNWKDPDEVSTENIVEQGNMQQEILEAEAVLNTIPKIIPRPEEKVYTTTQSAILTEAKSTPTAVPLPPPSSSTPRWDSEN